MKENKVTGIGGVFFKCKDPQKQKEWYANHLGIKTDEYGASFKTRQFDNPDKSAYLQWSPFSEDTEYFQPSQKPFMINYRVTGIEAMVEELRASGVTICDEIASYDYGKFVHIMDPEGNKLELWEPVDEVFDKYHDDNDKEVNT
ncbi:MAG: VOC family protein [Saprospiraceae bacterium]|nr:VOC family protein [Saprospiraceae bacterium]